ncbi:MAG: LPS export ABC transporter periplasmic protein LptC [Candidatus Sericytochromatia bacterium]|nr:LPS export ABC transporter periplasmic protein LptC [Candidatus Sericytochromatia bacterium]
MLLVAPSPQAAESPAKVHLFADNVQHDKLRRLSVAKGHVRVVQGEVTVFADGITYDEQADTSTSDGKATIVQTEGGRKTVITGAKLVFYHRERRVLLEGPVHVDRPSDMAHVPVPDPVPDSAAKRARTEKAVKAARTVIDADKGEYWTRTKKGKFTGNVVLLQKEKKAKGDTAELDDAAGLVTLTGKARVEQIKGNWLVTEGVIENKADDVEHQRSLRNAATIDADKIDIYSKTNDLIATGNVVTEQKGQVSRSQKAVYRDKEQEITLTETVRFERQKDEWMTSDRAVYNLKTERFVATGEQKQIESKFIVRTDPTPAEPLPDVPSDQELGPSAVAPTPLAGPPGAATPPIPSPGPTPRPLPSPTASPVAGSDGAATPQPVSSATPSQGTPSDRQMQPGPVLMPPGQAPKPPSSPSPTPSVQPRLPPLPRPTRVPTGPRLPKATPPPVIPQSTGTPRPRA